MKYFLTFLFAGLLLAGCGGKDPEVEKLKAEIEANQLERRDDLVYLLNQEKPFTGVSVEKYRSGQKKWERTYKAGKKISAKEWDEDGNPLGQDQGGGVPNPGGADASPAVVEAPEVVVASSKLKWRDGLRYFEGKPFTGGAVYGKYKNGQKKFKRTFKDGKGHGLRTAWYETGQKHWESTYKDGNLVTATAWKPNGEKCPDTNLVDGNGIVCSYHKNGQKNKERTYKDGEEISTKEWDEDGNPK